MTKKEYTKEKRFRDVRGSECILTEDEAGLVLGVEEECYSGKLQTPMCLSYEMVEELLPHLQHFVEREKKSA